MEEGLIRPNSYSFGWVLPSANTCLLRLRTHSVPVHSLPKMFIVWPMLLTLLTTVKEGYSNDEIAGGYLWAGTNEATHRVCAKHGLYSLNVGLLSWSPSCHTTVPLWIPSCSLPIPNPEITQIYNISSEATNGMDRLAV